MSEEIYNECQDRMEKSVHHYQSEVSTIRTGRASTALLDSIKVDFYGTLSPLNNIALISAPDAHLITIQPYDPNALEAIEKAQLDVGIPDDGRLHRGIENGCIWNETAMSNHIQQGNRKQCRRDTLVQVHPRAT